MRRFILAVLGGTLVLGAPVGYAEAGSPPTTNPLIPDFSTAAETHCEGDQAHWSATFENESDLDLQVELKLNDIPNVGPVVVEPGDTYQTVAQPVPAGVTSLIGDWHVTWDSGTTISPLVEPVVTCEATTSSTTSSTVPPASGSAPVVMAVPTFTG